MALANIMSEITGKIWKVEAKAGQRVSQEEQIIVIESMKMEIPVFPPFSGTIREIMVNEGQDILEGQIIAVIES